MRPTDLRRALLVASTTAQTFVPATNPPAVVKERVAATDIEITYHRPSVKGRTIFGALVPYGNVWRTGSDNAALIEKLRQQ